MPFPSPAPSSSVISWISVCNDQFDENCAHLTMSQLLIDQTVRKILKPQIIKVSIPKQQLHHPLHLLHLCHINSYTHSLIHKELYIDCQTWFSCDRLKQSCLLNLASLTRNGKATNTRANRTFCSGQYFQ